MYHLWKQVEFPAASCVRSILNCVSGGLHVSVVHGIVLIQMYTLGKCVLVCCGCVCKLNRGVWRMQKFNTFARFRVH